MRDVVLRHGGVKKVLTDQGSVFRSQFMEHVFTLTKTKHVMTSGFRPQVNGPS